MAEYLEFKLINQSINQWGGFQSRELVEDSKYVLHLSVSDHKQTNIDAYKHSFYIAIMQQ